MSHLDGAEVLLQGLDKSTKETPLSFHDHVSNLAWWKVSLPLAGGWTGASLKVHSKSMHSMSAYLKDNHFMDCVDPTAMGAVVLPVSPSLPEAFLLFSLTISTVSLVGITRTW